MKWVDHILEDKIDDKQFGGGIGTSTTDALVEMIHHWCEATDRYGTYVRIVLLDFAKAFDLINHEKLLVKLQANDVPPHILRWMASFLLNRTQQVKIGKNVSSVGYPKGGVPQGTVSGPRNFITFINDLTTTAPIYKYVDDSTIFEVCQEGDTSQIQESVDMVDIWTSQNDTRLNSEKCKEMIIDFSRNYSLTSGIQSVTIGEQVLERVEHNKMLGVTISNNLTWSKHVDNIVSKAGKRVYMLYQLKRAGISQNDLVKIYVSIIRPVLEYACPVWSTSLPKYLSDAIEMFQKHVLRSIHPGLHYDDVLVLVGLQSLKMRRDNICYVAISNSLSKVFELILLDRCEEYLWTSGNQFGFKANHSTEMCIYALHEFIDYYRSRSTNVYVTFLDASKAFDRINHWLLFDKLLKREMPCYIVRILVYWYRTQTMYVQWASCDSSSFKVTNGVRQGGILSPKLFIVYMDDLSDQLNNSNIGGNFGSGQLVNHISYADDMCLLSFSTAGMQKLLNICDQYSNDHDLIYNSKKTMCMAFTPKSCKSHECKLSLNQESLSYVREARYLGVVIQSSGTDKDVHRQMRKYYAGINTLIRRFYACSYDVKCFLFRSYISNMYCGQFWFNSTKYCLNKLRVSYNNSCRRLLRLPMRNSASGMFVQCNLLSFGELLRKSIFAFRGRIQSSNNAIIKCIVNSVAPLVSNVWKWWRNTLVM